MLRVFNYYTINFKRLLCELLELLELMLAHIPQRSMSVMNNYNQSINQSISKSITQSISQSINQLINQLINQSINVI